MRRQHRYAITALVIVSVAIVLAGVAVQVRSIHCRRFVDQSGGSNVECRVLWRVP